MVASQKVVHELETVLHNDATLDPIFIPAGNHALPHISGNLMQNVRQMVVYGHSHLLIQAWRTLMTLPGSFAMQHTCKPMLV